MSNRKGHLFVVSGPSGTGKSTLIKRFLSEDTMSQFSVSCTTREMRPHEVDGRDYRFVDVETFQRMIESDQLLEWENVHGYYYGTPRAQIAEPLAKGIDIILDIDVKGALNVKEKCDQAVLIFVDTPSMDELVRRLVERGEKEIEKRMERVREEVAKKGLFTYVIINDTIESSYTRFKSIIGETRRQQDGKDNR